MRVSRTYRTLDERPLADQPSKDFFSGAHGGGRAASGRARCSRCRKVSARPARLAGASSETSRGRVRRRAPPFVLYASRAAARGGALNFCCSSLLAARSIVRAACGSPPYPAPPARCPALPCAASSCSAISYVELPPAANSGAATNARTPP